MESFLNKIKLKVVYLWYDYLTYRSTKVLAKYFRLKSKIDALEVKYMNVDKQTEWEKLVNEAKSIYSGDQFEVFENLGAKPSMSISGDLQQDVSSPVTIDIQSNRFLENN